MTVLAGRNVVVTGASSGIGRAVAVRCAWEGAQVLGVGRRAEELERTAAAAEGRVVPFAADLADAGAADGCVAEAVRRFGRIDGLVHAAGTVLRNEDPRATDDATFAAMVDVNLAAAFRLVRAALRSMTADGRGGSIVLLSSQLAHIGLPGYATYCAAKGGIESLVRALAAQFGPDGVRVNALAPGVVRTPMAYVDRPDFDEQEAAVAARHPLRRIGEPDDLAGPAVFLLGDDARWLTGQSLVVDGGFTIQ